MLSEALKVGRALILLDGLDEVRDINMRNTVVERVVDFFAFHRREGNKFVMTSRVVGYRAVRPSAEDLVECTIVDFEEDEIEEFITFDNSVENKHRQYRRCAPMRKQTAANCPHSQKPGRASVGIQYLAYHSRVDEGQGSSFRTSQLYDHM
jgi:predicted NACHT family NTPase